MGARDLDVYPRIAASFPMAGWAGRDGCPAMEEGNPLDRLVSTGLILLALGIFASRRFNWRGFFAQ